MPKFKPGDIIKIQYDKSSTTHFINLIEVIYNKEYAGKCLNANETKVGHTFSNFIDRVDNAYKVEKLGTAHDNPEYLL